MPRRCERRTLPIELIAHICEVKCYLHVYDWLAEWSKALVLGTSLFGGVGSNPTSVIFFSDQFLRKTFELEKLLSLKI